MPETIPETMPEEMPDALVVEDDQHTLNALATLVELEGFSVRTARTLEAAAESLQHFAPHVVLSDLHLPDGRGIELLQKLPQPNNIEFILITGEASVDTAVEALRLGAYDYLTKPVDEPRLKALLANVNRTRDLKEEISELRGELKSMGRFGSMIGTSAPMQELYSLLEKVAPTNATVFLKGESGTGKELAAETVHQLSRRRRARFVAVNCGAVSPTLIESQLFGHERGAFTGADRQHRGLFEQADGGTLFLDEVTEMPLDLQVKLLRVLETNQVTRVGGQETIPVDARIVAATNRDPFEAVAEGQFREDLLYRLRVFPIDLPPLRLRSGDVELLADHFLKLNCQDSQQSKAFSQDALNALIKYPWHGNVRELRNVVQRAFIVGGDTLESKDLPPEILQGAPKHRANPRELQPGMSIAEAERVLITTTLEAHKGDKKSAAEALGISLKTLYNRLNAYSQDASEGVV